MGAEKDGREVLGEGGHEGVLGDSTEGLYLIQGDVADGGAVDLQNAVAHMDGVLHVGADAVGIHPADGRGSVCPLNTVMGGDVLGHCPRAAPPSQWEQAVVSPVSHLCQMGMCCHGTQESPLQCGDIPPTGHPDHASCPHVTF